MSHMQDFLTILYIELMTGLVYPHHLTYIACLSLAVEDAILQNRIKVRNGGTGTGLRRWALNRTRKLTSWGQGQG